MGITLPTKKVKATRKNPKTMVVFSQPKTGKTTALAGLENSLILDLEDGSEFLDAVKINIIREAQEAKKQPIDYLVEVLKEIKKANDANGGPVYKFIAIDTTTALEEMVKPMAAKKYKSLPMGKNWTGKDVTTLPQGAGYHYLREAFQAVINMIESVCDTLILLGHVKDKDVNKEGEEITERSLALTGKTSTILCTKVDAVGYMYRKDNETIIDFKPSPEYLIGSRSDHLKDQKITVVTSNEDGVLTIDWSKIFID